MNRIKHILHPMKVWSLVTLIPCFLLVGCVKNVPIDSLVPPPPKVEESVLPSFVKVGDGIDNTIEENIKLNQKIKEQQQAVLDQKITISEALAQAEKIKEKVIADLDISTMEATNLITELKKVETRNLFLETTNSELTSITKDQETILNDLKIKATETLQKILSKDNEISNLRTQNDYLGNALNAKNKDIEQLQKDLKKQQTISARASVYRNWVIGIVSCVVLWTIIKNILMAYFPIKFRI